MVGPQLEGNGAIDAAIIIDMLNRAIALTGLISKEAALQIQGHLLGQLADLEADLDPEAEHIALLYKEFVTITHLNSL